MHPTLKHDQENLRQLLDQTSAAAYEFLAGINGRSPATNPHPPTPYTPLPENGLGTAATLATFRQKYEAGLAGSPGPRYLGFITGGTTPAALVGDWLAAAYDQNVMADMDSIAPHVEYETIHLLRQLFGLPDSFFGTFVSGATMSSFVGLALARQWLAQQHGLDVAQDGLYGLPPVQILTATPHSSIYKAAAMLGLGRNAVQTIPTLPNREAVDVTALAQQLAATPQPCIVVGNAGTVNSVDFDDLPAIARLKTTHNFWFHVDAAFGGFAACSPAHAHLVVGLETADSITIDAHKWLNVPYDSAMQFSHHPDLQAQVFSNAAAYLGDPSGQPSLVNLTPQNSRRFRALPAWFSLLANGRSGYRDIVERNCQQAQQLTRHIATSSHFRLLAETHLNVVCFTLNRDNVQPSDISRYLTLLRDDGRVFLTPTSYKGIPAIRAAFSNWQTSEHDVAACWQAMNDVVVHMAGDGTDYADHHEENRT
ncbi:MAG: aspartate aminotransferase family protein [Anaerolineales bacterium]|nr:aspartate aminotransferase family protein [Anaerolineales bacterium]